MIVKFNFKIYYFHCSAKTEFKVTFDSPEFVNTSTLDVKNIKSLLKNDIYYLYENLLFEVIYTIPKLNDNNNYYIDFLLIVNNEFDLNIILKKNFELININSVETINIEKITFEWVEKIFNSRNIFNNITPTIEEEKESNYNVYRWNLSHEDYIKNYNNGSSNYEIEEYQNTASKIFYENLNQNEEVDLYFKMLDTQIWSFDRMYVNEQNKFGYRATFINLYRIDEGFVTNFAEIIGSVSVEFNEKNEIVIDEGGLTPCCIADNEITLCIHSNSLNKKAVKTGYFDISNLLVKDPNWFLI